MLRSLDLLLLEAEEGGVELRRPRGAGMRLAGIRLRLTAAQEGQGLLQENGCSERIEKLVMISSDTSKDSYELAPKQVGW